MDDIILYGTQDEFVDYLQREVARLAEVIQEFTNSLVHVLENYYGALNEE